MTYHTYYAYKLKDNKKKCLVSAQLWHIFAKGSYYFPSQPFQFHTPITEELSVSVVAYAQRNKLLSCIGSRQ